MLDIKTALLLWAMEAATLAVLLAAVWVHDRTQRHIALWALGFLCQGTGIALVGFRGAIPDLVSIEVANAVALLAFFFWIGGLLHLARQPLAGWASIPMLLWIAGVLVPAIRDDIAYRIALYNVGAACGHMLLAVVAAQFEIARKRYRRLLTGIWTVQATTDLFAAVSSAMALPSTIQGAPFATMVALINLFGFLSAILIGAKIVMDRSEERLQHLIRTDPLTGALNRRGLTEAFERAAAPAPGAAPDVALLLFDLDHFKRINDTHGHQAGDAVLVTFAEICRKLTPKAAIFGRTGGEEFMLVARIADMREAALMAEAIRMALAAAKIAASELTIDVTVSIGIATAAASEADLDKLMSGADRALYKAKARGRNRSAVLVGEKVLTVPAQGPEGLDEQTDRQVAALRKLATKATLQTGLSKP
ncbi:GGDEF domain-containing protein [Rhizobium sp. CAU 1783]